MASKVTQIKSIGQSNRFTGIQKLSKQLSVKIGRAGISFSLIDGHLPGLSCL